MSNEKSQRDVTTWIPMCCERVMRHNVFGSGNVTVATFVCTSCGKHISLQPHSSGTFADYGEGAHILEVLAVSRPAHRRTEMTISDEETTM
ncbi:MAG TPA: hypothetical protein VKE92_02495 [Anaerolineales bacterium]|nr:hypothetical protein [Anaerolineales bacterium]